MDTLVDENLVDKDTVVDLLKNDVVLITPKDSKLGIKGFKDITKLIQLQSVILKAYQQVNTQKKFLRTQVFTMKLRRKQVLEQA